MQWRQFTRVLFVGLCSAGVGGCANLRLADNGNPFASAAAEGTAAPTANADVASQAGLSLIKANAGEATASGQPRDRMLEGQLALARLCERRGENDNAKEFYRALLKKVPRDARVHHRLGVVAVQEGDFAAAEEHFRTAQSLAPPTAELLSDIGYCYYLQHKLPEAENVLQEALKLEPTYPAAINNLALVLGREGRFQESLDLFKRTNSEAEAYANLAYVLTQNGQLAQAQQMYLRALTLDNRMRAAAQAMLQINDRSQTQAKLHPDLTGASSQTTRALDYAEKRSS
jgi:Flp pilus assembly protein TadD